MDVLDLVDEFMILYEDDPVAARDILRILVSIVGRGLPELRRVRPFFGEEPARLLWNILKVARTKEDIEDFIFSVAEEIGEEEMFRRRRSRGLRW